MHTNTINSNDVMSAKFYHLYAIYYNESKSVDKELMIAVDGHAIYYIVRNFGSIVKETTDFELATKVYNEIPCL